MNESMRKLSGEDLFSSDDTDDVLDELARATDVLDLLCRADRMSPPQIDLWGALLVGEANEMDARLYVHCPAPISPTALLALADSMEDELCACVDGDLTPGIVETARLSCSMLQSEMISGISRGYRDHLTRRGTEVVAVTRAAASVVEGLTPGRWHETDRVLEVAAWMLGALTDGDLGPRGIVDPISGVHTRSFFDAMLCSELARHQRTPSELSIVLLQLRRSAALMADERPSPMVLAQAGLTMRNHLREADIVARLDTRRMAALLPCTGPRDGLMAATRLGKALQDNQALEGWSIDIGVSGVGLETASPTELVDQAAHAMHSARRGSSDNPFVYV